MFLQNRKLPLMKAATTTQLQTKPKSFSYQRPTQSSIQMSRYQPTDNCRHFKSALDMLNNRNTIRSYRSLRDINFHDSKIFKSFKSFNHSTKSQFIISDYNNLSLTDDENYDDDYIVINPLNSKYGDDITKLNSTQRIPKSNFTSATSRNGSGKLFENSNNSITISNLKSNSKKFYDSKKKFKKKILKPTSLTSMNEVNLVNDATGTNPAELGTTRRNLRFTALLSSDAQFSFLKAYEDMIYVELSHIYPYISTIPRTSTAKFIKFINLDLIKTNNENNDYDKKIKIAQLMEQAMKILDSIQKFKEKLKIGENQVNQNQKPTYYSGSNNPVIILEEEEDEPLEM